MSDTSKPAGVSEQEPSATVDLPAGQSSSGKVAVQAPQEELLKAEGTGESLPAGQAEPELENLQLLTRFLLGGLLMGGGSFMQIVRDVQREIEAEPDLLAHDSTAEDESLRDLFRYLSICLLVQGTERVSGLIEGGFRLSLDVTRRLIGGVDRVTDNRVARPFRRAMASRLQRLEREAELVIDKGRVEERNAKLLTGETIDELIDQVVDKLAESPELTDVIIELVSQQGKGMASIAGDNARSLSVIADNITERLARRLLRRKSRQELPPSPMYGVPQTMYSTDKVAGGTDKHEQ
jgi:hypothetical protein